MQSVRRLLCTMIGLCALVVAHATGFSSDATIDLTASHQALRLDQTAVAVTLAIEVTGADRIGTVQLVRTDTGAVVSTATTDASGQATITTHLGDGIIPNTLGSYPFQAVGVTNDTGTPVHSATWTITVTAASIALTSPTDGITYLSPASIPLTAALIACDGLTIDRVEFYRGTTLVQTVTSAPYTVTWTGMADGTYTLTAKAYIHLGETLVSAPVHISVTSTSVLTEHPALDVDAGATGDRWDTAISADGRYVAFISDDPNLVLNDTNGLADVFVYDRQAGTVARVNVSATGAQADADASDLVLSADGRYVAFSSSATNLVSGDTNGQLDVFVRDRQAGTTTRVSEATDGTPADGPCWGASVSADGTWVAFLSDAPALRTDQTAYCGLFAKNLATGELQELVDFHLGDQLGCGTAISADGSVIAFTAQDPTLDSSDTSGLRNVYTIVRATHAVRCISHATTGNVTGESWGPSLSADGSLVAFLSEATNLVGGDTNAQCDVFVYDRQTESMTRIASPEGNDHSWEAQLSGNGRYVVFTSDASNLVGDTNAACDIFRYDRQTEALVRVSLGLNQTESNGDSWDLAVNSDGSTVVFTSTATNLTTPAPEGTRELYVTAIN